MGVKVVELTSKSHNEDLLSSMHQLRLQGQLVDVTVQVDYQGDVQEFQAHQVVLAAASGYFKDIFVSQDAGQDQLLLSNMHSSDFATFLDFVYTGKVEVAKAKISEVQAVAQLLECKGLVEVCSEALSAGIAQTSKKKKVVDKYDLQGGNKEKEKKQIKSLLAKHKPSSQSSDKKTNSKRLKADTTEKNEENVENLVMKKASDKAGQTHLQTNKDTTSGGTEEKDVTEGAAQFEDCAENGDGASFDLLIPRGWEYEGNDDDDDDEEDDSEDDEVQTEDIQAPLLGLKDEDQGEQRIVESHKSLKRTSKGKFQCDQCQRTFWYERSYLKHISTYHGVEAKVVYRCTTCQQSFANSSNLKIHEKHVHSNERLFSCTICSKTFKRKKDVVRHQRQVHERNTQRHVCQKCGKSLSSRTALLMHERTHTGAKPFACSQCDARFSQNAALKMHVRIHTGEKPYACDECDARFTQKHMLSYHKRSHSGEKPFMCDACGKSFASKEYLRHHSNIHTGFKPYKCERCGRGFSQRNSLQQHLKIHTGERPYSCKECDKTFTQINALQRHQRIHTGEKPYMCNVCNRTFTDMSTLRRHTTVHDTNVPWKTYLVVVKGNVEDKTEKGSQKEMPEKAAAEVKKKQRKTGDAACGAGPSSGNSATVASANRTKKSMVAPGGQLSLPSEWPSHGTIALVSHAALGGITVIHTDAPMVTTDSTGANIISLNGSTLPVPFSIPVSMAHTVPLSSEASSASFSVPSALSVPVSEIPTVSTSSVLETAVSQTILAPLSENKISSDVHLLGSDIKAVIIGEEDSGGENSAALRCEEQPRREDEVLDKPQEPSNQDAV